MKIRVGDVVTIALRVEKLYDSEATSLFIGKPLRADGSETVWLCAEENVRSIVSSLPPVPGELWAPKANSGVLAECIACVDSVVYYRWKTSEGVWKPSTTLVKLFLGSYTRI